MIRFLHISGKTLSMVGAVAGIVGAIAPLIVFVLQGQRKELTYEVVSESRIVDLQDPLLAQVEVSYAGKKLSRLVSLSIRITNTGNVAISRPDFDRHAILAFGDHATILQAQVLDQNPPNLNPTFENRGNDLLIAPTLLNAADRFTIQTFVTGDYDPPILDARILGIKKPAKLPGPDEVRWQKGTVKGVIAALMLLAYAYFGSLLGGIVLRKRVFRRRPVISMAPVTASLIAIIAAIGGALLVRDFSRELNLDGRGFPIETITLAGVGFAVVIFMLNQVRLVRRERAAEESGERNTQKQ